MKALLVLLFSVVGASTYGQLHTSVNAIHPETEYDNSTIHKLHSDSLSTSLIIWIKKDVAAHHHQAHSECLYVLEGNGDLKVGNQTFHLKAGDFVNIPVNTVHSLKVTSAIPMKVISIQAPEFLGKDRIFD